LQLKLTRLPVFCVSSRRGSVLDQVDESLLFETHLEGIAWFHELILFFDDVEGDEQF